jgi:hypothetical protein
VQPTETEHWGRLTPSVHAYCTTGVTVAQAGMLPMVRRRCKWSMLLGDGQLLEGRCPRAPGQKLSSSINTTGGLQ